jgi:hypothetical protein
MYLFADLARACEDTSFQFFESSVVEDIFSRQQRVKINRLAEGTRHDKGTRKSS